ncbi:hypothetical protein FZ103_22140 [Streptomonospora sp. PA3]|uniref:hypothetical protein n=1 Tax=Streptomonospora sp. PA3 TaxID=2607326 RepID=UPI0012DDEC29|nr:hypothetical protein [Streptomonospora sp. PA3]MUL43831.1 hypothetical protein [Streptomonospora sp. PA3]
MNAEPQHRRRRPAPSGADAAARRAAPARSHRGGPPPQERAPASASGTPRAAAAETAGGPADAGVPEFLLVDLVAPAIFAGASAAGTAADSDVVTDAHGLPYLPRQRIAARLRDAAVTAVRAEPALLPAAQALFGASRRHGPGRILRIGHATPPESVRAAVAWALEQRGAGETGGAATTLVRAVTDAFTSVESGVAIDGAGAPADARLRTVRVIDPGLRLTAALRWTRAPEPEEVRCLARAALAFTQAGLKAGRGRGRVDVRLTRTRDADADSAHIRTLAWAGIDTEGTVRETGV